MRNGATGVFQGKILVKPGAQKTDGYQISQSLLLDGDSQFLAKPELEIYADDVACSHGSTSGAIDEEGLFYLRSRGVPKGMATDLLTIAFLAEAVMEIEDPRSRTRSIRGSKAGSFGGAAEPMPVTRDIAAMYRGPGAVMRRQLARGRREDRALAILMAACALVFISQWPALSRAAHLERTELNSLLAASLLRAGSSSRRCCSTRSRRSATWSPRRSGAEAAGMARALRCSGACWRQRR